MRAPIALALLLSLIAGCKDLTAKATPSSGTLTSTSGPTWGGVYVDQTPGEPFQGVAIEGSAKAPDAIIAGHLEVDGKPVFFRLPPRGLSISPDGIIGFSIGKRKIYDVSVDLESKVPDSDRKNSDPIFYRGRVADDRMVLECHDRAGKPCWAQPRTFVRRVRTPIGPIGLSPSAAP